jgi:putative hemolysin
MNGKLYLLLPALVMVLLAGLFAGSETGIYRLSRLRLRLGVEKRKWPAILLEKLMRDSSALLLSLLVGTNLSHYLATSLITGMFLSLVTSEHVAELYATLLTAPLLFIFSELIPKNVFLYRADTLTSFFSPLLYATHKALTWCGIVPLLKLASGAFARLLGSPAPSATIAPSQSHQAKALLRDTREEGFLSRVQTEMIDRIVNIPSLRLHAVMVPLDRVRSVNVRSDRAALLNELSGHALTRLPVWQDSPTHIIGSINIYETLASNTPFESLEPFVAPIRSLDAETPIIDAIDIMRREKLRIVLVTRERAKRPVPVGIVTMKDLVEELLGELAEW